MFIRKTIFIIRKSSLMSKTLSESLGVVNYRDVSSIETEEPIKSSLQFKLSLKMVARPGIVSNSNRTIPRLHGR